MGVQPQPHLDALCPLGELVLLSGDPDRSRMIAQQLLLKVEEFSRSRGLLGYTGKTEAGRPVTVQTTGMGTPSLSIVVNELMTLGARTLIRVGTCGSFDAALAPGQLIAVSAAFAGDGTSQALGATGWTLPDPELTMRLAADDEVALAPIVSTDLFYETRDGIREQWIRQGARAVEMESAALFQLAGQGGAKAATLLGVSDQVLPEMKHLARDQKRELGVEIARRVLDALA